MGNFVTALCLGIIVLVSGCSNETAKRTAFETLQNVRQQECIRNPSSSDCDKRDSYDDYQRQRKELKPSE